jgi:hypothetical protein
MSQPSSLCFCFLEKHCRCGLPHIFSSQALSDERSVWAPLLLTELGQRSCAELSQGYIEVEQDYSSILVDTVHPKTRLRFIRMCLLNKKGQSLLTHQRDLEDQWRLVAERKRDLEFRIQCFEREAKYVGNHCGYGTSSLSFFCQHFRYSLDVHLSGGGSYAQCAAKSYLWWSCVPLKYVVWSTLFCTIVLCSNGYIKNSKFILRPQCWNLRPIGPPFHPYPFEQNV